MTHYLLIVDPDIRAAAALRRAVGDERFQVHAARNLTEAEGMIATVLHAVVIASTALMPTEEHERAFVHFVRSHSASTRVVLLRPEVARCTALRE